MQVNAPPIEGGFSNGKTLGESLVDTFGGKEKTYTAAELKAAKIEMLDIALSLYCQNGDHFEGQINELKRGIEAGV